MQSRTLVLHRDNHTLGKRVPRSQQSQLFAPTDGIVPVVEVGALSGFVHEVLPRLALGHIGYDLIAQYAEFFQGFDLGGAVVGT